MATVRCPGCDKVLIDFMQAPAHYADPEDVRAKKGDGDQHGWPYTTGERITGATLCEWDRDYLAAEYLRLHPELMTWSPSPSGTTNAPGCDTISDPTNGANHV